MAIYSILPELGTLEIKKMVYTSQGFEIHVESQAPKSKCSKCQVPSHRVHGYYERTVWDLSWQNQKNAIHMRVRKFFLPQPKLWSENIC